MISFGIVLMMYYGKFVLIPLFFGILLAIIFDPFIKRLMKVFKKHAIAYAITVTSFIILMVLPFYVIGVTMVNIFGSKKDSDTIREAIENFTNSVRYKFLGKYLDRSKVESVIESAINFIQDFFAFIITDSMAAMSNIILALLFSYFLHAYFSRTKKLLFKSSDPESKKRIKKLAVRIPVVIRSYISGTLTVMLIIASLSSLLLLAVGLKYAVMWGAIIGLMTIIPYVGSALGITLPMAYSLLQNQSATELLIIGGGYLIIQIIEGNFITPKIVGDKVGINPFIIIICMMLMAKLWGIAGIMITIPCMAVIKIFLEEYGHELFTKIIMDAKG